MTKKTTNRPTEYVFIVAAQREVVTILLAANGSQPLRCISVNKNLLQKDSDKRILKTLKP